MYYQIVKLSGVFYARRFESIHSEANDMQQFLNNGDILILCDDLEGAADFLGVFVCDIQIVN
ncbi:MAG: hypothetical protein IMZ47_05975 [Firmicutes bacterium]|nr:hypothetical protein [Bacillota bacterium]